MTRVTGETKRRMRDTIDTQLHLSVQIGTNKVPKPRESGLPVNVQYLFVQNFQYK